ncbi:chloride channel protein [Bordetella holmesii]|nr:chloride channel protein [Bordetella holmesii]AIT28253.1 voltage gated chloride channel family protein [Bordetella holmesii 44057]EWM42242.1 voltage gated chloride channel family protein [Bordetella holmesii 41130]AMD46939.1 chloride channel protein [Bordetella holmesii H558]AOB35837.1 chloride channel protein [Bordetella holmesii]AUL19810.1 chloride channel protein [Bordetella holmesii]
MFSPALRPRATFTLTVLLVGLSAGVVGLLLSMLLHAVQHLAFGYSLDDLFFSHRAFLYGVMAATPERRVMALIACGLVAGLGWGALYRWGRPLVSVKATLSDDAPPMPPGATLAHAILQIITVGLGSPLGREAAPREAAAMLASGLARHARLNAEQRRILVACAAGAGLAAVYNVPLAGAVFALEGLLATFCWQAALIALATSAIAAAVAWLGLGMGLQYVIGPLEIHPSILVWAMLAGPIIGAVAHAFSRMTDQAKLRAQSLSGWPLIVLALLNFTAIGLLSVYFPALLGNGKGPAQLGFDSALTLGMAAVLLCLKMLVSACALRVRASGGLLTPGMACGALLATLLGGVWNLLWPGAPLGAYAVIGAAAFLGTSMHLPFTAIVLVMEFTQVNHNFVVPIALAVAGALATARLLDHD